MLIIQSKRHPEIEGPGRSPAEPAQIWKARRFIHENLEGELSLRTVAAFANISANYLSERFKEVTGVNFVDYIARSRCEKAHRLLSDQRLRISEIAFAVGFQSLSQFNRVFKKLAGKSPTEYRAASGETPPQPLKRPMILRRNRSTELPDQERRKEWRGQA